MPAHFGLLPLVTAVQVNTQINMDMAERII